MGQEHPDLTGAGPELLAQPARPCGEAAGAVQHPCAGPSMRKFPLHQIIPISSCPTGPGPGREPLRFSTKPLSKKPEVTTQGSIAWGGERCLWAAEVWWGVFSAGISCPLEAGRWGD